MSNEEIIKLEREAAHLYLTDKQYVAVLHRQRDRIEAGVGLDADDCNITGMIIKLESKNTL